ncbi:aspartate 1-decarboxylase [Ensifer sp. NM-2]|uniref:aspartate 1-decarboxylase n=1 Tax=Ensifer sp. NM-2 TaxID=2109730 RepID=UPI00352BC3FA
MRSPDLVILGEHVSRCGILNGALARVCKPGDSIIICNSVYPDGRQHTSLKPKVPTFCNRLRSLANVNHILNQSFSADRSKNCWTIGSITKTPTSLGLKGRKSRPA